MHTINYKVKDGEKKQNRFSMQPTKLCSVAVSDNDIDDETRDILIAHAGGMTGSVTLSHWQEFGCGLHPTSWVYDTHPTTQQLLDDVRAMAQEHKAAAEKAQAVKAERARKAEERRQKQEAERKAREEQEAREREQAAGLPYERQPGGKFAAVCDLHARIKQIAGLEMDHRFGGNFIKDIASVNYEVDNGFMYLGDLVPKGTSVVPYRNRLFLVAGVSGSRKNHHTYYTLVKLEEGYLHRLDVADDNSTPGWALRLRDTVHEQLNRLGIQKDAPPAPDAAQVIRDLLTVAELAQHYSPGELGDTAGNIERVDAAIEAARAWLKGNGEHVE